MQEEQVDVINAKNQKTGTVSKSVAHRDGLLHRIVIAELRNSHDEYCFVRQSAGRQDGRQFVSPVGGHVSAGESIENAFIRESQEEIGITPVHYKFMGSTIFNREVIGRRENHLFMVYEIESDLEPKLNHESTEFRWFAVPELKVALETRDQLFGAAWHHVFGNVRGLI